jgi:hypothetical protein
MGWFSAVTNFITGTPKLVDNVFDKDKGLLVQVGQWVGHQNFTEEEKAKMDAGMSTSVQAFAVATLGENTDRSKARRQMATRWFDLQIMLIKLQVVFFAIDKLAASLGQPALNMSGDFANIAFNQLVWGITGGIGLFFWGSHTLRSSKFAKDESK